MVNVVLVIDMLKGFLEEGYPLYCGEEARAIIPHVKSLLEAETAKGSYIIFICDNHQPDDKEFQMFLPHCIAGTPETEVISELASFPGERINKRRYSGFFDTPLEKRLKELKADKIIVVGVCTDICVMHTVADARNRDYQVEVPEPCVASFDKRMHQFALEHIEKVLGARIT